MPVSSGRVNRRSRLKRELLDSPGWVAASGQIFSTPQSGFKKTNRRSTLFPDTFSPRRTRRQTIVMSVPVMPMYEETSPQVEAGDDNALNTDSSKRMEVNGAAESSSTSEIKIELMKAPSKRAIRSGKSKTSKSSSLASKPLPSVSEQPSESRRSRGRPPKVQSKRTTRKKDKENVIEKASDSEETKGELDNPKEFELPSMESEIFEQPSAKTKSRRNERSDVQLTATPMLLLNRVDMNHQPLRKKKSNGSSTPSPPEDDNPIDESLYDSKLADTSISSLNTSQAANTSGRCYIL